MHNLSFVMYKSPLKFPCPHCHEKTGIDKTKSSNWRFSIRTEVFGWYKKLNQFWLVASYAHYLDGMHCRIPLPGAPGFTNYPMNENA